MALTRGRAATSLALATASCVEFEVAPATTGTRPAATSTVTSITRSHSSCVRVGVSPVVPQGIRKSIPDSTCQETRFRKAVSSTAPSGVNGVTRAVPQSRNWTLARRLKLLPDFAELEKSLFTSQPLGCAHRAFGETTARLAIVAEIN